MKDSKTYKSAGESIDTVSDLVSDLSCDINSDYLKLCIKPILPKKDLDTEYLRVNNFNAVSYMECFIIHNTLVKEYNENNSR